MNYEILQQNPCIPRWKLVDDDGPVSFEPLREFVEAKITIAGDTTVGGATAWFTDLQLDSTITTIRTKLYSDSTKLNEAEGFSDLDPYYKPYKIEILHAWKWNEQAYRWESGITTFYTMLGRMRGYYVAYQFGDAEEDLIENFVGTLEPRAMILSNIHFTSLAVAGGLSPGTYIYVIVPKDSMGRRDFPYYISAELTVTGEVTISFSFIGPVATFDVYRDCELLAENIPVSENAGVFTDDGLSATNPSVAPFEGQDADVGGDDALDVEVTYTYPDEGEHSTENPDVFVDTPGPSDDVNAERDIQLGDWVPGTVIDINITDPTTGDSINLTQDPIGELPDNDYFDPSQNDNLVTDEGTTGQVIGQDDNGNDIVVITNTDPDGNEETVTVIIDPAGNPVSVHSEPTYTSEWIPIETLYNILDPGIYVLVADENDYRWPPTSTWADLLTLDGTRDGVAYAVLTPTPALDFIYTGARIRVANPAPDASFRELRVALTAPIKNPNVFGGPNYAGHRYILYGEEEFDGTWKTEAESVSFGGPAWPVQVLFALFDSLPDVYATGKVDIEFEKRTYDTGSIDFSVELELPSWLELPIVNPTQTVTTQLYTDNLANIGGVDYGSVTRSTSICSNVFACDVLDDLALSLFEDTFRAVPPSGGGISASSSTQNTNRRPHESEREIDMVSMGITGVGIPENSGVISI